MVSAITNDGLVALMMLRQNSANKEPETAYDYGQKAMQAIYGSGPDAQYQALDTIVKATMDNGGLFIKGGLAQYVEGSDKDDYIYGVIDGSVSGGGGNDHISTHGGYGTSIDGGDGDDTIYTVNNVKIIGAEGNDEITANSHNVIDGGAGNDNIRVSNSNEIRGSAGDDKITLRGSDNVVHYSSGDGKDTVEMGYTSHGVTNVLKLGEGISKDDITISYERNHATISFAGRPDDEIFINFMGEDQTLNIELENGEQMTIEPQNSWQTLFNEFISQPFKVVSQYDRKGDELVLSTEDFMMSISEEKLALVTQK